MPLGYDIPVTEPNHFSLLMSVYGGDSLTNLRRSVESNTVEQTLPPDQLVIVRDGPVPANIQNYLDSLREVIQSAFAQQRPNIRPPEICIVPLQQNRGLAHALNTGLAHCTYEIVARADSDDISLPARFSTMIPLFSPDVSESPDIVGSAIQELESGKSKPGQIRVLPEQGSRATHHNYTEQNERCHQYRPIAWFLPRAQTNIPMTPTSSRITIIQSVGNCVPLESTAVPVRYLSIAPRMVSVGRA